MQERDLVGYGANPPRVRWPNNARIAISLVVNYEEGSENLLQDGIGRREMTGESRSPLPPDRRDLATESIFEYGSRAGIWRFFRIQRRPRRCPSGRYLRGRLCMVSLVPRLLSTFRVDCLLRQYGSA
jgi:hypothetical protein